MNCRLILSVLTELCLSIILEVSMPIAFYYSVQFFYNQVFLTVEHRTCNRVGDPPAAHHPTHNRGYCTPHALSKKGVPLCLPCVGCTSHGKIFWQLWLNKEKRHRKRYAVKNVAVGCYTPHLVDTMACHTFVHPRLSKMLQWAATPHT